MFWFQQSLSVAVQGSTEYKYSDLMSTFADMLDVCAGDRRLDVSFATVVCINAFRGFLDEFVKKLENRELPEVKMKKRTVKRKKKKRFKEYVVVSLVYLEFDVLSCTSEYTI